MKYVALLRGINVGTGVRVPMKSLRALSEGLVFGDVAGQWAVHEHLLDAQGDRLEYAARQLQPQPDHEDRGAQRLCRMTTRNVNTARKLAALALRSAGGAASD